MTIIFITLILGTAVLLSWPLGRAMTWAMNPNGKVGGFRNGAENLFQKAAGQAITREQTWKEYALSMLLFNAIMFIAVYAVLSLQQALPLNPDGKGALAPSLIFHTAAAFTTNTDFQHYSGEVSLIYF
jgi:K+-transporting ATPase ATPase A chain